MKIKVGVLFGGESVEHEVSIITAVQAMEYINKDKYEVVPIYIDKERNWYTGLELTKMETYKDMELLKNSLPKVCLTKKDNEFVLMKTKGLFNKVVNTIDVAFPIVHGKGVEDGSLAGYLDTLGIPYVGPSMLGASVGQDKVVQKQIMQMEGIPVANYVWFYETDYLTKKEEILSKINKLGYPVIVKPANLGSSVGIGRAGNREQLISRLDDAQTYSSRLIVEHMVDNLHEVNCSVLGDADEYQTSVCEEPIKSGEILSYTDKYMGGSKGAKGMQASQKRIPADLPKETTERIRFLAGETFRVLSCQGVARVDVIMDEDNGCIYVNEINTIPGSLSFYLWEASGIPFSELMDRLVRLALKRKREESMKTVSYDQNIFAMGGGVKGGIKGSKA